MDTELTRQLYGSIEDSTRVSGTIGDMPSSMLTSKYEETDMGPDEDLYDDYARGTLIDQRPDKNKFEYEEPRGAVNARSGVLQLHYNGHRGEADPYLPEAFLGFGGHEDRDPRGINTAPDMKQMVSQQDARMRFIRFTSDGSDNITGGGRSPGQLLADQQTLRRLTKDRLKVFSRQIDGRREGSRITYNYKSNVNKQQVVKSYGDNIHGESVGVQRKANIIAKSVIRDSEVWRSETADQSFTIAKYSQLLRRARTRDTSKRVANAQGSSDNKWTDADASKCYKATGLLMSNIIRGKKQAAAHMKESDIDFATSQRAASYKTAPYAKDLALILRAMAYDTTAGNSDVTVSYKNIRPTMEHLTRQIVYGHIAPAHHYLNAEILYKNVKPGADTTKIKKLIQTDANSPEIQDMLTQSGKSAKQQMKSGAQLNTADDSDKAESARTVNYRTLLCRNGDRRIRVTDGEDYKTESDNTQSRATSQINYRATSVKDVETGMKFLNNTSLERRTRGLGTKYTARFVDRDAKSDDISGGN